MSVTGRMVVLWMLPALAVSSQATTTFSSSSPSLLRFTLPQMTTTRSVSSQYSPITTTRNSTLSACTAIRGGAAAYKKNPRVAANPAARDQDLFDVVASLTRDTWKAAKDPNGPVMRLIGRSRAFVAHESSSTARTAVHETKKTAKKVGRKATKLAKELTGNAADEAASPGAGLKDRSRRIVGLSVISWLFAEILDFFGVLSTDNKDSINLQALKSHPIVTKSQKKLTTLRSKLSSWWSKHASEIRNHLAGLSLASPQTWPRKYQWASGAAVGMMLSPSAWPLLFLVAEAGGLLYVLAVLNESTKQASEQWNDILDDAYDKENLLQKIDLILTKWRSQVDAAIADPEALLTKATHGELWLQAEELPVDAQRGVLCGVALGALLHV